MLLRHISPRSTDWMDAMDEGSGGRGWEKLAPEEQAKLLRERPRGPSEAERELESRQRAPSGASGRLLRDGVAFEIGDQDLRGAILRAPRVVRVPDIVHEDREHERQVTGRAGES